MKIVVEHWPISKILKEKEFILEQPLYQRGKVWPKAKKQLLLDSVMRGYDMPKIYLRKLENDFHKYEVADGQQRLDSIFAFCSGKIRLPLKSKSSFDISYIAGDKVGGLNFNNLKIKFPALLKQFLETQVTISIVNDATDEEIRTLFGRLQLGTQLNTAEKRNVIISDIGREIDNSVLHHPFFASSAINPKRFTRQDLLAHAVTLCFNENHNDLKAELIDKMYYEKAKKVSPVLISDIYSILKWMSDVNQISEYKLTNKWTFVDTFWFMYKKLKNSDSEKGELVFNFKKFATLFEPFEERRRTYYSNPNALISAGKVSQEDKNLFAYLTAFKTDGALIASIRIRSSFFDNYFSSCFSYAKND